MTVEALAKVCDELIDSVDILAVVGAALRIRSEGLDPDPRIGKLVGQIAENIKPGLLDGVSPEEAAIWFSSLSTVLRQTLDFIDKPARPPGWSYEDPAILDSQGRASRIVVSKIEALAEQRASLAELLGRAGRFLDVGTGAGWISIEAAQRWPTFQVVGIDIWEPSIALALRNVNESGVADRVTIRRQGLQSLEDESVYDLVWLPGPFLPEAAVAAALPALLRSLVPGGTLVFALYGQPASRNAELMRELEIARYGGHGWTKDVVEPLLESNGFRDIACYSLGQFYPMVAAQRPFK